MACGVPQIVPEWSALGEWCRFPDTKEPAVLYVPVTSAAVNTGGINTIGGVADEALFIDALERMYVDADMRKDYSERALKLMAQPAFRWDSVAAEFHRVFSA